MNSQNILNYYGSKLDMKLDFSEHFDFVLDKDQDLDLKIDNSEFFDFYLDVTITTDLRLDNSDFYDFQLDTSGDPIFYKLPIIYTTTLINSDLTLNRNYILSQDNNTITTENGDVIQFEF
jgi:hypothetical protein